MADQFCLLRPKVVHLRYSKLNNLAGLELDGWEELSHLDISYNQLSTLSFQNNTPLSRLVYLDLSGNRKLRTLQSIQVLQTHLRFLHASRCQLSDASALEDFSVLEVLDLHDNLLTSFPARLPALQKLNLRGNLIDRLPSGLCDSIGLLDLNLQGIQLKALPNNFSALSQLERLSLRANRLGNVAGLEQLSNLRFLDLTKPGNGISFALCNLSALKNLAELRLVGMRLTEVPDSILDLPSLFFLDLSLNSITAVPNSDILLSHAVPWRRINVSFNSLTEFPVGLLYLQGLEHICARNNVFELPEVVASMDSADSLTYWRKQFNISLTSSRRTSASSETLSALIGGSELFRVSGPSSEQTDIQESIWFDLYSYRSEKKPAAQIPAPVLSELGRELILDRITGCLYGLALADAYGVSTEFMTKDTANFYYDAERGLNMDDFLPDQHRLAFESGDWTDDTDQTMLILDNLVQNGGHFDALSFARSLQKWVNSGFPELGDEAGCGCGNLTFNVIAHSSYKTKPHVAAAAVWEKSGKQIAPNGAVMRTAVLGCAQFWNRARVISDATAAAQTTHADPRCVASAVAVSAAISSLISSDPSAPYKERIDSAIAAAVEASKPFVDACPPDQQQEFIRYFGATSIADLDLGSSKHMGYTFKALGAGFYALREAEHTPYADILTKIILEAGDADTNGAVAGGLLGALLGYRLLPAQWISSLRHHNWMNAKIKSFMDLYGICLEL